MCSKERKRVTLQCEDIRFSFMREEQDLNDFACLFCFLNRKKIQYDSFFCRFGSNLREYLLLEYASGLMSHHRYEVN